MFIVLKIFAQLSPNAGGNLTLQTIHYFPWNPTDSFGFCLRIYPWVLLFLQGWWAEHSHVVWGAEVLDWCFWTRIWRLKVWQLDAWKSRVS